MPARKTDEKPQTAEDGKTEEPMVTYHGASTRREITQMEWRGAGVPDMPTVFWERRLGATEHSKVPVNAFTEQALQVLRQDQDFQVP